MRMGSSKNTLLENFPIKKQLYSYDCSVSSLWSVLRYLGYKLSYWEVYRLLGPNIKDGVSGEIIEKALTNLKIKFISEKSNMNKLRLYCHNNIPSIVSIQHRKEYNKEWKETRKYGHYVVVLKVTRENVFLMDPKYGKIKILTTKQFIERWHDADEKTFYRKCAITCIPKNNKLAWN